MPLETYKEILIPIDGSDTAKAAFYKAIAIANLNHAHLHILHVIDSRAYDRALDFRNSIMNEAAEEMEGVLAEYKKEALDAGVAQVDTYIEFGSPKGIITGALLKDLNIDLIVLGAVGKGAVERVLVGSVAEYATRKSPVDTIIAR